MKSIKNIIIYFLLAFLVIQMPLVFGAVEVPDADALDKLINVEMVNYNLPGAVVGIVKDGDVLYSGVLGEANLTEKIPVDASKTVFQTGSVTKVFTTMALLQLMEETGIQADEKIAPYLPGTLSSKPAFQELTFRNVLDHTTGIPTLKANSALMASPIGAREMTFSEEAEAFLTQYDFTPVIEPGQYTLFSNVNNILEGVLIESLSGQSYETYLAKKLLRPMGMTASGELVLGDVMDGYVLAQNYSVFGGRRTALDPFEARFLPSDDFLTTLSDMNAFMQAMTSGTVDPAVYDGLFTRQASNSDLVLGRSYGFSIVRYGSYEAYVQDGGIPGSNARLLFIPEENLGIFIAYNSGSLEARSALTHDLILELLGSEADSGGYATYSGADVEAFSGSYQPINASDESIERLTQVIHQVRIQAEGNQLMIDSDHYDAIASTVFYNAETDTIAEFQLDENGQIAYLVIGNTVYKKAVITQSFLIGAALLIFSVLFNLAALLILMMRWGTMRVNRIHDTPRVVLLLHTLIFFVLMFSIFMISTQYDIWNIIYGGNTWLTLVKTAGILTSLLIIPSFLMLNQAKNDFRWSGFMVFVFRIQQILSVLMIFWLFQYNFI